MNGHNTDKISTVHKAIKRKKTGTNIIRKTAFAEDSLKQFKRFRTIKFAPRFSNTGHPIYKLTKTNIFFRHCQHDAKKIRR